MTGHQLVSKPKATWVKTFPYFKVWSGTYFEISSVFQITDDPAFKTNILQENGSFSTSWMSVWNETRDLLWYFFFFFPLQSYSEEVAASAQAWVDKCILAHGAPSTRKLNGIFLLPLFLLSLCLPFTLLHICHNLKYYLRDIKVPCELTDLVADGQSRSEHYLISSLNTFF